MEYGMQQFKRGISADSGFELAVFAEASLIAVGRRCNIISMLGKIGGAGEGLPLHT